MGVSRAHLIFELGGVMRRGRSGSWSKTLRPSQSVSRGEQLAVAVTCAPGDTGQEENYGG